MTDKDQIIEMIAGAYGQPFAGEGCDYTVEEEAQTVKRVQVMTAKVCEFILANNRVPSSSPKAPIEEQMLGHWMQALQFYSHIAYDHKDEGKKLNKVAAHWHDRFQKGIRWGGYMKPE